MCGADDTRYVDSAMIKQPTWLLRIIEIYSNKTKGLVDEHPLPTIDLETLQRLWNRPSSDPMIEMFEVTEAQREFLESIDLALEFCNFSYFLAARKTDLDAQQRDGGFMGFFAPPHNLSAFPEAKSVKPKARVSRQRNRSYIRCVDSNRRGSVR